MPAPPVLRVGPLSPPTLSPPRPPSRTTQVTLLEKGSFLQYFLLLPALASEVQPRFRIVSTNSRSAYDYDKSDFDYAGDV